MFYFNLEIMECLLNYITLRLVTQYVQIIFFDDVNVDQVYQIRKDTTIVIASDMGFNSHNIVIFFRMSAFLH